MARFASTFFLAASIFYLMPYPGDCRDNQKKFESAADTSNHGVGWSVNTSTLHPIG